MSNVKFEKTSGVSLNIIKGLAFSFILTLISIFIFSLILTYSNISESIIPVVIILITCLSILIGSIISVRSISKDGLLNGTTIGSIYVLMLFLISSLLNTGFCFNIYTILMIITGIMAGIIGGIIGVNLK